MGGNIAQLFDMTGYFVPTDVVLLRLINIILYSILHAILVGYF